MIKAIIFDMDGVLIDAKEWHYESLNKALTLFGVEISRHDHLTTFDGLPTRKKLEILSVESVLPVALHDFVNELKQIYTMEIVHTRCKPRFIHERALSKLKTMGYRLAVASNSIGSTVELMMSRANLDSYLDLQLSTDDIEMPKPNPEIYLKSFQQLGLNPKECLVIEDNENGVKAAIDSGAEVMRVSTPDEVNLENILMTIEKLEKR